MLTIGSAFLCSYGQIRFVFSPISNGKCSPLAQQNAVLEVDSPHSSQNRENSSLSTAGENMSMAAGKFSPGHVTDVAGDLHSADQAGLSAGRSSLRYQGTDYMILDEAPSKHTLSLSQGDSIVDLVVYPEALQLALSHHFGEFASLRFNPSGLPQVVLHSVGPIQAARQSAWAPPHSVSSGTSQAVGRSRLHGALQPHGSLCLGSIPSSSMVLRFGRGALIF